MNIMKFGQMYATTEVIINDWELSDRDRITAKIIRDNFMEYISLLYSAPESNHSVDMETMMTANMMATHEIMTELTKIVNVQANDKNNIVSAMQYISTKNMNGENEIGQISLDIVDHELFPTTYKLPLGADSTLENFNNSNGLDLFMEKCKALSKQCMEYQIYHALDDIVCKHKPDERVSPIELTDFDFHQDGVYKFVFKINRACVEIARKTRRAMGNVIVISSKMLPYFEKMPKVFSITKDKITTGDNSKLQLVGTWGNAKVYLNDLHPDKIIIGYVGKNDHYDASLIFSIKTPLMYAGKVCSPSTLETNLGYMTRYNRLLLSTDYYAVIDINFPEELDSGI